MNESSVLTEAEVAALPEGMPITVIWSGGNGPADYVIAVDRFGQRYAAANVDPTDPMRWYNPLTFVGQERFHTRAYPRVPSAGDDGGPVCPGNERRTT